ncbi:MAG: hypothetical protein JXA93_19355, partial [Anaerolineae bacterium]|nr:hypothetical protein [Anaerolineae bacterium]
VPYTTAILVMLPPRLVVPSARAAQRERTLLKQKGNEHTRRQRQALANQDQVTGDHQQRPRDELVPRQWVAEPDVDVEQRQREDCLKFRIITTICPTPFNGIETANTHAHETTHKLLRTDSASVAKQNP